MMESPVDEIAQSYEIIDKTELDANEVDDESNNNNIITTESTEPPAAVVAAEVEENNVTTSSENDVTTSSSENDDNNNQSGNRKYTRDQLIKLKQAAVSAAPSIDDSVKGSIDVRIYKESSALDRTLDRTRRGDAVDKMMPAYANSSTRGSYQKQRSNDSGRRSQQGTRSQSTNKIQVTLQSNEDVKLNEAKDAWKPTVLGAEKEGTVIEEVMKQFRSILNKITPENFTTLIEQLKVLKIDTVEILDDCISLVFEKAIMEPSYGASYAQLCKEVSDVFVVPLDENNSQQKAVFKKRLITQCQREFEKHRDNELIKNNTERLQEIEDEEDPTKKEELKSNYDSESFKIRRRAVGTVHFIGELYKIEMLTSRIMVSCISHLLDPAMCSEETLECLCKLLTTIGKRLEKLDPRKVDLTEYFTKLEGLADKKNTIKISSRIRFMIQDLIELRLNNWTPRKLQRENKPLTMEEIKQQVVMEQYINKMDSKEAPRGGGEDRNNRSGFYQGGNANNNKRGNVVSEDGWSTQYSKSRPLKLDMNKIQIRPVGDEPVLGGVPSFQNFGSRFAELKEEEPATDLANRPYNGRFSGGMNQNQNRNSYGNNGNGGNGGNNSNNNYNNRGGGGGGGGGNRNNNNNNNNNNRSAGSRSLQPPMQPNNQKPSFGPSRKLSQQQMPMNPRPNDLSMKPNAMSRKISAPARASQQTEFSRVTDRSVVLNVDQVSEAMKKMLKAYQSEEVNLNEAIEKLRCCKIGKEALTQIYNWIFDQHDKERFLITEIICEGVSRNIIMTEDFIEALHDTFEVAQDLACDLPKIYCYIGQLLALPLLKRIVQVTDLLDMSKQEIEVNNGGTVLKNVFKVFEQKYEKEALCQLYREAGIDFQSFLDSDTKLGEFLIENVSVASADVLDFY